MKQQGFVTPLAFWAGAVNAAEIETAVRAYERGDYSSALVSFHTLARQGNSRAQHYLGEMYANGHGVPQETETALRWYEEAAQGGEREAQLLLGSLYADGVWGVRQDRTKAYAWLSVAASKGDSRAATRRDQTAERMAFEELERAEALYQNWLLEQRKS